MHQTGSQGFFLFVSPLLVIGQFLLVFYMLALVSGWRVLAQRFRAQNPFLGPKWHGQSASLRNTGRYNHCLTIGADSSGLFIVPLLLFRLWHPALLIPWTEITFERKKVLFLFSVLKLRLGTSDQVPFTVSASLGAKIEAAAGASWPTTYYRATSTPPPPIG
ncbi:MAG TPA: hypothetical protein VJ723_01875 [Candidatus Angelobacter sp.]|nr:hypothetical protein [Candidatus Angelobacter sp.]